MSEYKYTHIINKSARPYLEVELFSVKSEPRFNIMPEHIGSVYPALREQNHLTTRSTSACNPSKLTTHSHEFIIDKDSARSLAVSTITVLGMRQFTSLNVPILGRNFFLAYANLACTFNMI